MGFLPLFTGFAAIASLLTAHFHALTFLTLPASALQGLQTQWLVPFNCHQLICCSFDEDCWGVTWQSMHCHCPETRVLLPEKNL